MNLNETLAYINSMPKFIEKPVLDVMKAILNKLDNPQDKLKFIHIAGTNGKGSVCSYISSILKQSDMTVGMFTSPFVTCFNERFQVNGEYITDCDLCDITASVKATLDKMGDDYKIPQFGLVTIIGFVYFLKKQCDVVVLEVGLGGRTDPTNVISTPLCSVITQIGLDHTDRLGDNIGQIAFEKGGIIKAGGKTVLYPNQDEQVVNVIRSLSIQSESKLIIPRADRLECVKCNLTGATFDYFGEEYEISIAGNCQVYNAVTAIETIKAVFPKIPVDTVKKGLKSAHIPARLQVISKNPTIILDGGHNADAVNVLCEYILKNGIKPACIIGMCKDKDIEYFIQRLGPICREIHTVSVGTRAETAENLAQYSQHYCSTVKAHESVESALEELMSQDGDILICGSLFVANKAYNALKTKFDI